MAKQKILPLLAICGRPNVGKSTLYNRLTGKQRAIVHDEEGITRDRHYGMATWEGRPFRVVDTGGIVENPIDPIVQKMQAQVRAALNEASVVLFLVDGQAPLTRVDMEIRDELFKYGKPVVLAVNKLDNATLSQNRYDYYELGMGDPIAISSGHDLGIGDLMDRVVELLPEPGEAPEEEEPEHDVTRVAIIGKPNVGKSSFVNAILNEERAIVDDTPGTTRDSLDIEFQWKGTHYHLIDTAGMRKKAGIKQKVEHFSVSRSLRTVRYADVCLVMVDATDGLTEQDKRIVNYVCEQGTAMVLVWTKWDLIEDKEARFKAIYQEIDLKAPFLKYVPYVTVSNLTRQRIFTTFEYVDKVAAEAKKRIPTAEFNKFIDEVKLKHKPSQVGGKSAKILYATQASLKPTTFVFFVNQVRLFHFSYQRYLENQIRERFGFEGVPITIELRAGKPQKT